MASKILLMLTKSQSEGLSKMLELQQLTKKIGSRQIIHPLDLSMNKGEVLGLLGPNGAGKTTVIRMIVGLMKPTSGQILIGPYNVQTAFEQAIRQVGAIVENPEMYKFLTGHQNLRHFARMVPGVDENRIKEVIELVGMDSRIHDKVKTYSLGMRQRLGVAQALLHRPAVLILDEPTNGLDPKGIRELRDYLRRLAREEGISVLVSSHLLSEMELMCDRVAIIQAGRLVDVRTLQHDQQAGPATVHKQDVLFELHPVAEALPILQQWSPQATSVNNRSDAVQASLTREETAEANRKLVEAGIAVYGITINRKSLEDQFLELTGGESVV